MRDEKRPGVVDERPDQWPRLPVPRPGFLLVVLLGTILLSITAVGDGILPGDVAVSRFVQRLPGPVPEALARFADWVGSVPGIVAVGSGVILLLVAMGRLGAAFFLLAVLLSRSLNPELKRLIESPRPTPDVVRVTEIASAMGFPSGHAMGVTLLYGTLGVLANALLPPGWPRRTGAGVVVGVILVTGFGRIQTGAHWPSDVLGGYLWGASFVLLLLWRYRAVRGAVARS